MLPFMFTALAIITMLKCKLRIYYGFKGERIPSAVIKSVQIFTIITVIGCILIFCIAASKSISDVVSKSINGTL